MAGTSSRDKGQRGEREVIKLLQPVVTEVCREMGFEECKIPQLERNLMQSHKGGYDIEGLDWMALEVKRQETLNVNSWWQQCVEQSNRNGSNKTPVLLYRQSRSKWRVRTIGFVPAGDLKIKCVVEISLEAFMIYFKHRIKAELANPS